MPVKRARLSKRVAKLLGAERVCRVATVGEAGTPHLVPVCHALVGDRLYFGSGDDARKVLNLKTNPQVAVTVDLYAEDWSQIKGVMVQGSAKLVRRGPVFTRARKRLYAKYPQYSREAALSTSDSVIVEVTPTHVFTWGLD
jgi:PPOX class probable F420-dependent enzyme